MFVYVCFLRKERYLAGVEVAKNGDRIESRERSKGGHLTETWSHAISISCIGQLN